jgi:hypothetical protein
MAGIPSPFSGPNADGASADGFDAYDSFVPAGVPEPGPFLEGHDVLAGTEHAAVHRLTRWLFDDRGVYDVTFGYNLARLNLDRRHPKAGYRYAVEADEVESGSDESGADGAATAADRGEVLRAEFTPTTPFCPQSKSLTMGSYRAWNGEADRHEYDLVRVRVHPMHHRSESINAELASLEPDHVTAHGTIDPETDEGPERHSSLVRDRLAEGEADDSGPADSEPTDQTSADSEPDDGVDLSAPF